MGNNSKLCINLLKQCGLFYLFRIFNYRIRTGKINTNTWILYQKLFSVYHIAGRHVLLYNAVHTGRYSSRSCVERWRRTQCNESITIYIIFQFQHSIAKQSCSGKLYSNWMVTNVSLVSRVFYLWCSAYNVIWVNESYEMKCQKYSLTRFNLSESTAEHIPSPQSLSNLHRGSYVVFAVWL